ncbi:hypothetical protein [Ferruginibacter sp. HRS2-29]|uniref:hypothetical protein n=1 Tax=Ferruginibacter sp. HRS2-29 TaxID=2487334 RepID=UPI0020CD48EC|nr:hypothetical protein [Ferruginibacter sp. HRS2-29]MCP9750245.1 hypothetical protein [Ferruginibacter sp. HRS2-29]
MIKIKILAVLILVLVLGYGAHMLIKKFINPRASLNHLFLFFLAHFIAIFTLAFLVNFFILHFSKYLFHT